MKTSEYITSWYLNKFNIQLNRKDTWKIRVPIVTWTWRALLVFRSTKNFTTCKKVKVNNESVLESVTLSITIYILCFRKWGEGIPLLLMTLTKRNQQKHPQTICLHITAKQISKNLVSTTTQSYWRPCH